MKLRDIQEGHWTIAPGRYPGSMYKGKKKAKRHSLLSHPDDRGRFVKEMGLSEDIDNIEYGSIKDDAKYEDAPTPFFGTKWKEYDLIDNPDNSSQTTQDELKMLANRSSNLSKQDRKEIEQQDIDNLEQLFVKLLQDEGEEVSEQLKNQVKQIAEEITTIGIHFKKLFNRPRPYQLMKELGIDNNIKVGRTTQSPSYPSTHAIIGHFLAKWLADKFPKQCKKLCKLGYDLGNNRVKAGYHYPSDFQAGIKIANHLLKQNGRNRR